MTNQPHSEPEGRVLTVRELAGDLRLAPNTVARAYRELDAAGMVETRGRHGTFVAGPPSAARREAESVAREFTAAMHRLGIGRPEALAMLQRQFDKGPEPREPA